MAKNKDRKRAETKQAPAQHGSPRQEVERLIQKGKLKEAVKQGKLCYRQESTPENHRLLERAYFLRAQQLHREAMPTSAAEVAQHLLEFGVTDPSLPAELAPLLLAVGLSGAAMAMGQRLEAPEAQARLLLTAADQAVLHPDRAPASLPEIREGALSVREAWKALDAGDEAGALDRLRGIARSSPFADWRYFVRGLAALRRRDAEQVAANWDRLDASRTAARIAQTLRSLTAETTEPARPAATTAPRLRAVETAVFGEPVLAQLQQLRQSVAEERWDDAIPLLTLLRFSLRRIAPQLAERLTRMLLGRLAHQTAHVSPREARQLIGGFVRAAEPLPIDPRWNRLRALIAEGPQDDYDDAEKFWRAYLADLETLPTLSPEERKRAQALVWEHLAFQYAEGAEEDPGNPFTPPVTSEDLAYAKRRATEYLEESIKLDPTFLTGYDALIRCYDKWGQPERAEAAAHRLLAAFPNHFETLNWLIAHLFKQEKHGQALPLIQRARELKPLDESLRHSEWAAHVSLARQYALKGRWDEGRAEFALAEPLWPEESEKYTYAARKAVFELKAAQADRAEEIIAAARDKLAEPTPLWLAILIEGVRYELPRPALKRFEDLWDVALSKKGKSETAGALAELLLTYLKGGIKYPDQSNHAHQLVDYLKRTSRIRYKLDDLVTVCEFLHHESARPHAKTLLENLAKRGLKNFPGYAGFHFMNALMELEKGPYHANLHQVRKGLDKALQLAQASINPRETELIPEIRKTLTKLEAVTSSPFGMPFPGFGGGFPQRFADMFTDFGFYDDDDYDEDDDEWDDDEDRPRFGREIDPAPAPTRPSRSTPKKKSKSKKKR